MLFDLFYELSVPDFAGRSEARVFRETLEELEWGERLGFRTAWLVEHHFMREYSHSAAPDLFLAAASARTRTLRLGYAIVPLPYHHPLHVAERVATLDVLSDGRVEFGFGRGFSPREYQAFGVEMAASRAITEEALEIIRLAFSGEPVRYAGRHFHADGVRVVPQVVQKPHPPLWSAAVSPASFEMAARLGVGVLVGPFKPWFMVKEDIRRYQAAWSRHQGNGGCPPPCAPRVAMTLGVFCHEDAAHARKAVREAVTWFYGELLRQTLPVLERLYESYEYYRKVGTLKALIGRATNLTVLETLGMVIVGNPAQCIRRFRGLRDAGVERVLCAVGAGVLPTQQVRACMDLLAREVFPALR